MAELVTVGDLAGFPGASSLSDAVIEAAAESVRDDCGWHIAPVLTETIEATTTGAVVILDTLRIVEVSEIRDAKTGKPITSDWHVDRRAGIISGLPHSRRIEVDLTHGYDSCPPALKPVILDRAKAITAGGYVRQESLGSRSVSYATGPDVGVGAADPLARYKIHSAP